MSDHVPTTGPEKRNSLHSQLQKTRSWVVLVVGSLFTVVMIGFQAAQFMNTLATKQQVESLQNYMISENVKLKQDLDYVLKHDAELQVELLTVKRAFVDHMEKHAGRLAAEREQNKARAAQSAARARAKFRESIAAGRTIEQALYDSSPDFL